MWVFGYGSLVHETSLAKGLGRSVRDGELVPAELRGFRRVWGASESVRCEARPGVDLVARFLDLVPDEAGVLNGAVLRVTPAELASLTIREKAYATFDVTGRIDGLDATERCLVFASPAGAAPRGEVVLAEYVRLVEEGFAALARGALERFRRTTEPPPCPVVAGRYRFVDPAQNARTSRAEELVA